MGLRDKIYRQERQQKAKNFKKLMDYQLSSKDSKMLADIEDIKEFVLDRLESSTNHVEITRCFESITGYGTSSSDEKDKKWVSVGK